MKKNAPGKEAVLKKIKADFIQKNNKNQRVLLLKALQIYPLATNEIRSILGINSPAPRVLELRQMGYEIGSRWVCRADLHGNVRRFSEYFISGVSK